MSDLTLPSPFQSVPQVTLPTPTVPKLAAAGGTVAATKLHQAAQDFEAIFLRQILAEARKSTMGDTLFSSDASSTFNQMQDARFADIAAGRDALGLAGMIERQLGAKSQGASAQSAPGTTSTTAAPGKSTHPVTANTASKGAGA